jgi:hypothetical protein
MVICGSYMFEFSVSKDMEKKIPILRQRRDQQGRRWGNIPKIASPMKSILQRKRRWHQGK